MRALICGFCGAVLMFLTCVFVAGSWDFEMWTERFWAAFAVWFAAIIAAAYGEATQ